MNKTQSVSDIISQVKSTLEGDFRNLVIEGEITNFSSSSTGHYYLNLKDNNSMISCALFRGNAMRNPIVRQLKDGVQVQAYGDLSVYAPRGTFQLIIKKIVPVGVGNLKEKFERLKKKLSSEGLFDLEKKKTIPRFPRKIAVVTALGAAALQDFLNIIDRRSLGFEVIISPSLVQGDRAPKSIIAALEKIKTLDDVDCVVMTRGGGSLEDLWAFNDEELARYISNYPIPTISAVGHQVDFTLADYVADKRLETPSAAAEFLSNPQTEVYEKLQGYQRRMVASIKQKLNMKSANLRNHRPDKMIAMIQRRVFQSRELVTSFRNQVSYKLPRVIEAYYFQLDELVDAMKNKMERRVQISQKKISELQYFLKAVNPNKVLSRGYAYAHKKGNVISSAESLNQLDNKDKFELTFHDGSVEVVKC